MCGAETELWMRSTHFLAVGIRSLYRRPIKWEMESLMKGHLTWKAPIIVTDILKST